MRAWPCAFLAAPILLALVVNGSLDYQVRGALAIFIIWVLRCLSYAFGSPQRNIGRSVSGLLAGIVLVDLLAIGADPPIMALVFGSLFFMALLFQRFIPAT